MVALVAVANLRERPESGKIFAAPTYFFLAHLIGMVVNGTLKVRSSTSCREAPSPHHPPGLEGVGLFLILRAFSSGCSALTGVEAVSDGVPAFKPPEAQNARVVLAWLGVILIFFFLGVTYLSYDFGIGRTRNETLVSQLGRHMFGTGPSTTGSRRPLRSCCSWPPTLPSPTSRACPSSSRGTGSSPASSGPRATGWSSPTASSSWAGLAGALLIVFSGDTHALIPLYAVGVFVSFTLSQIGMVRRWLAAAERRVAVAVWSTAWGRS